MSVSCCPAFHCILSNVCFSFSRLIQLMVRHIKDSVFKARSLLSHVWPLSLSPSHSQFLLLTCSRLLLSPFTARHIWVSSSVPLGQCNATLVFLWVFLWFLGGLGGGPSLSNSWSLSLIWQSFGLWSSPSVFCVSWCSASSSWRLQHCSAGRMEKQCQ